MPPTITVSVDGSAFARLGNAMKAAGRNAPVALAWGINAVGAKTATRMRRALVAQTGMKYGVFVRALRTKNARPGGSMEFRIDARGGDVRLKFFSPRETRAGTSAAPWNKRTVYAGAFMKGGRFPNRVPLKMGRGNVFKRVGKGRNPIKVQRSGLYIPEEMVTGASREAFNATVSADLPRAVERALYAILSGVTPSARAFR